MSTKKKKHNSQSNDSGAKQTFNKARHKYNFKPRNPEQAQLLELMQSKDLVFVTGDAGTGKTHVLIAEAVRAFKDEEVSKIYLARPAVDAGEKLGHLPGTLEDKIGPYMLPYLDELSKVLGHSKCEQMIEDGEIEFVSFANIRGRTLEGAFVILDEAQNTTVHQMKTFLTRIGEGARVAVMGDAEQSDLPSPHDKNNGLTDGLKRFKNHPDVGAMELVEVVRSHIAAIAVNAYKKEVTPVDVKPRPVQQSKPHK